MHLNEHTTEMMAYDEVTAVSHYLTGNWGPNSNFNFTPTDTDGKIYTCTLKDVSANVPVYFRIVKMEKSGVLNLAQTWY